MKYKDEDRKKINYFRDRCHFWYYEHFSMRDIDLTVEIDKKMTEFCATATTHDIEQGAGMATISCSLKWIKGKNITDEEIDRVAFHEVCEVLLSECNNLMDARYITPREIRSAIHRVINRLEYVQFGRSDRIID